MRNCSDLRVGGHSELDAARKRRYRPARLDVRSDGHFRGCASLPYLRDGSGTRCHIDHLAAALASRRFRCRRWNGAVSIGSTARRAGTTALSGATDTGFAARHSGPNLDCTRDAWSRTHRRFIRRIAEQRRLISNRRHRTAGAVAEVVGIKCGVVSGVLNLESSGVEASDWRPRHEERYHEA